MSTAREAALGTSSDKVLGRATAGRPPGFSKSLKTGPKTRPKIGPVLDHFWTKFGAVWGPGPF